MLGVSRDILDRELNELFNRCDGLYRIYTLCQLMVLEDIIEIQGRIISH